jgi:hypothetical protein
VPVIDFVLPVVGLAGLGNMLFPWARAEIFARQCGARVLQPAWNTLRIGPYLRREPDKRHYIGFFDAPHHVRGMARLRAMLRGVQVPEERACSDALGPVRGGRPQLAVFEGLRGYFDPLLAEHDFIRRQLWLMTRPSMRPENTVCHDPFVAMHVRRGDLTRQGLTPEEVVDQPPYTPLSWFVAMAAAVRRRPAFESLPIVVFTDGSKEEVAPLLDIPNVRLHGRGAAITDLWILAGASVLFASGYSTFSMWASFLGGMPTVYAPGKIQQHVQRGRPRAIEIELAEHDDIPVEVTTHVNSTAPR